MAIVGLALCLKALVPTGFMIGSENGGVGIEICGGQMGGAALLEALEARGVHMPMAHGSADKASHERASQMCPYGALGMAMDTPLPPVLLALAIAFLLATGFAAQRRITLTAWRYRSPPPRGPPVLS